MDVTYQVMAHALIAQMQQVPPTPVNMDGSREIPNRLLLLPLDRQWPYNILVYGNAPNEHGNRTK